MKRAWCAAAVAVVMGAGAAPARADDEGGLFGVGSMAAGLSGLFGERRGGEGFGVSGHFELAMPFAPTALGSLLGVEFQTELGYESYRDSELLFDIGLGFPVTVLQLGGGGPGTTLLSFALGAGVNVQHAYAYVRGRLLVALSPSVWVEAMGRWTPQAASTAWVDEEAGLDTLQLRASVFLGLGDVNLQLFAEWDPADIAYARPEDPQNLARFPEPEVHAYQDLLRVGVGLVF